MDRAKKIFWWVLLGFLIYAIFTQPDKAAAIVRAAWDIVVGGFNAILKFFNSLLNGR